MGGMRFEISSFCLTGSGPYTRGRRWRWFTCNHGNALCSHEAYLCLTFTTRHASYLDDLGSEVCLQLAGTLAAVLGRQRRVHAGADTASRVPVGHLTVSAHVPAPPKILTTQRAVLRLPAILSIVTSTRIRVPLFVSHSQKRTRTQERRCSSSCRWRCSVPVPFQAARGGAQMTRP